MPSSKGSHCSLQNTKSLTSLLSSKSSTHAARELYNKPAKNKNKFLPKYVPPCNEVRQRVLSAKALRNKTFRNQLLEAEQIIANLKQENRMLMTIHQRQDSALAKYESTSADLPNLLNAHVEELNSWEEKHKKLQYMAKDIEDKIKQKETIVFDLNEDIKYYGQLNKNKTLDTKENLEDKINALQMEIRTRMDEQKKTTEYLQNEIIRIKQEIQKARSKANDITIKVKQMKLEVNGMEKVDALELEKAVSSEQTNNEDTDASINCPTFNIKKPIAVSESIPTRIPFKKNKCMKPPLIKNIKHIGLRTKQLSVNEVETKGQNNSIVLRKPNSERGDGINVKPLRRGINIQQGGGDGPTNKASQLHIKSNIDRGDGDGPTKHKSFLISSKSRTTKQGKKSNAEDKTSKKVIFCDDSQNLGELSNYGDTDGNESLIETVDSQTADMSVTSELTADTGNLADTDNADDHDDHENIPKPILGDEDDLNMDCMGKIMSGLRVQMSEHYTNQHIHVMDNDSELEQSN